MQESKDPVDLTVLPEDKKQELLDYYHYLVYWYSKPSNKSIKRFQDFVDNPLPAKKLIIFSRDELHAR